mgnify:CR=1 FL=1
MSLLTLIDKAFRSWKTTEVWTKFVLKKSQKIRVFENF